MLTLIVTCVLFTLIPSLFRLLLVFGEHAGIWSSLKQHVVVCDICSASLQEKKSPFEYFKSLKEINIYSLFLIRSK